MDVHVVFGCPPSPGGFHVLSRWGLCERGYQSNGPKKGSPVHVAPACAGSREGSHHFGSYNYVPSLGISFYDKFLLQLHVTLITFDYRASFSILTSLLRAMVLFY
jgi:hypothetical protein